MQLTSLQNTTSLSADLGQVSQKVNRSLRALSSGELISRAADDIARLSIGTKLSSRVNGLRSAAINVAQATSLLQVADRGLADITDMLMRMQALTVMAASGTVTVNEKQFLNLEFQALKEEVERVAQETNFNGVHVLNGGIIEAPDVPPPGVGRDITGTNNPEFIAGTQDGDTIEGLGGDDNISALGGDDLILPGLPVVPGLQGSIYRSVGGIGNLAAAEAVVAAAAAPDATFTSLALDYPQGAQNNQNSTLNNFLGTDGASISDPALLGVNVNRMVFVFEGFVQVPADGVYNFNVGTDDGFNLQIDGVTALQFPNNRGFGFTNGNVALTAGSHPIRFLFWENGGQEGMEVFSSMSGGGILDQNFLTFSASASDGDDVIDGGDGDDIVVFEGNIADYTITQINDTRFTIQDNRVGVTNGFDTLENVEIARFADGDVVLIESEEAVVAEDTPRTIEFVISEESDDRLEYVVVDATLEALFDDPDALSVHSQLAAEAANEAVLEAIDRTTMRRAYVGSLQSQATFIDGIVQTRMQNQDAARAVLQDTDIARTSTDLVLDLVKRNSVVAISAQTNAIHQESISNLMLGITVDALVEL